MVKYSTKGNQQLQSRGNRLMRSNGQKLNQLREGCITTGYTNFAEVSVLISIGNTRVLCNAMIEDDVPRRT